MDRQQAAPTGRSCGDRLTHSRVLRGGSFLNNNRNVRCAYRNNRNPNDRNNNIGFRLVVVSTLFQERLLFQEL
ncbi:MAG: SUMF1/EgtB/PvdO family nonheme iron enzyme [Chloroflexi bacterium]|nr:SUMF1/EgtB/PvdO family nonheme iron enzyme [Chloroflexota bacterium]